MKNILLTYDYEVFFVKFGTVSNSLLTPTQMLVNKMNEYSMKGTFFVDVLYLDYLRRQGNIGELNRIQDQLRWLVSSGHRIELHIHPHWLDTDNGEPNFFRYRLQSFSKDEQCDIFELGLNILYSIANKEDSSYKVLAYRAGGWCIQPFNALMDSFRKYKIKIDSSVAAGMYQKSESHFFDFRNAPVTEWYRYKDDVNIADESGDFIEIPISTFNTTPFQKLYKRWIAKKNKTQIISYGDGYGMTVSKFVLLKKLFESKAMYSIDGIFDNKLMSNLVDKNNLNTINFISHPKNITNYSLSFIDNLYKTEITCFTIFDYYMNYIMEK